MNVLVWIVFCLYFMIYLYVHVSVMTKIVKSAIYEAMAVSQR